MSADEWVEKYAMETPGLDALMKARLKLAFACGESNGIDKAIASMDKAFEKASEAGVTS
jgi:hypothetical protein